jgi:hypothetical protein
MKPSHLVLGALVLFPLTAAAQPSAAPPASGGPRPLNYPQNPATADGFHDRAGRLMIGFSLGLGGMKIGDDEVTCGSCDYDPVAGEFDFHIGGMVSPRLGIMFEAQGNVQTIDESELHSTSLVQTTAMVAVQYWLTTQLWLKGGIGGASLGYMYDDEFSNESEQQDLAEGGAAMAAIGYELLSARTFSIDAQARMVVGSYRSGEDVSSGSIGVGFNWY